MSAGNIGGRKDEAAQEEWLTATLEDSGRQPGRWQWRVEGLWMPQIWGPYWYASLEHAQDHLAKLVRIGLLPQGPWCHVYLPQSLDELKQED